MKDLDERFRKGGTNAWPKSYQVVVRCRTSADAQLAVVRLRDPRRIDHIAGLRRAKDPPKLRISMGV